jgi:hypothetical protein
MGFCCALTWPPRDAPAKVTCTCTYLTVLRSNGMPQRAKAASRQSIVRHNDTLVKDCLPSITFPNPTWNRPHISIQTGNLMLYPTIERLLYLLFISLNKA